MYKLEMPDTRSRMPRLAMIVILLLIVGVIALVVLIGSQQPDSSTQASFVEFGIATEELTVGQDLVVGVNNATLYVPRAAIQLAGSISIFPREPDLFSNAGEPNWSRPLVVNVEFRDEAGTSHPTVDFSMPVEMCFKITRIKWLDYLFRPDEYQVQYYAEAQDPPRWESLPLVPYANRSDLCGQTEHLSLFALAIKDRPPNPFTDGGPIPTPTTQESNELSPSNDRPKKEYEP